MAFTITQEVSSSSATDASSYTTASFTVNAGDLVLAVVTNASTAGTASVVSSVTGTLGLTWAEVGSVLMNSSERARTTVLWADAGAGATGTVTFNFGGVTQANGHWTVVSVTGADNSDPIANFDVEQTAGTDPTVTMSPAPAATSMVLSAMHANATTAPAAGSGFTLTGTPPGSQSSPTVRHGAMYDLASPGSTAPWVYSGSTNKAAIAVEIREATGAAPVEGAASASLGGTASGQGVSRVLGTASSSLGGSSTAAGIATKLGAAVATLGGTSAASGTPRTQGAASASLGGTASASGIDRAPGTATASLGGTATATGSPRVLGSGVASLGGMATASGTVGAPPVAGSATSLLGGTASAEGVDRALGAAVSSLGGSAVGGGLVGRLGTAAAALGGTATASGQAAFTIPANPRARIAANTSAAHLSSTSTARASITLNTAAATLTGA